MEVDPDDVKTWSPDHCRSWLSGQINKKAQDGLWWRGFYPFSADMLKEQNKGWIGKAALFSVQQQLLDRGWEFKKIIHERSHYKGQIVGTKWMDDVNVIAINLNVAITIAAAMQWQGGEIPSLRHDNNWRDE